MGEWGEVKARLEQDLRLFNKLPHVQSDIRAALQRVEELEQALDTAWIQAGGALTRMCDAEAKLAEEYERGYQDGRESTLDNPHVLAAEKGK